MARPWDFEITPYRGVGPLTFGLSKEEVRALLGPPEEEFARNPEFRPDCTEWIYDGSRCFISFDPLRGCVEIMLTPPADPRFAGVRLLGMGASEAWAELRRLDPSAFVDETGCHTSRLLGVNVHAPDVGTEWDEPGVPALSVLVFNDPEDERLRAP
jgi:hypothetical protein